MTLITVIGRGHSGTRAMSHTLSASGVFMGEPLNRSGDLLPPQPMYDACQIFAKYVTWHGDLTWDWDAAMAADIPASFTALIDTYLTSVRESAAEHKGWKIPETTLVFPWIERLFPEARYILWVRNPRDCILGHHLTDDLAKWGIPYPAVEKPAEAESAAGDDGDAEAAPSEAEIQAAVARERLRRAISWKYQYDLVRATVKPAHWIEVRFEDFVLRQDETLARLEDFLSIPLAKIPVNPEAVGRWKTAIGVTTFDFLAPAMAQYGYDMTEVRSPMSQVESLET